MARQHAISPAPAVAGKDLSGPALKAFFKWKKELSGSLSRDVLERISYVLGIYKALQILCNDGRNADEWISRPNAAKAFGGDSALKRMLGGNVSDLYVVRQYLDAQRLREELGALASIPHHRRVAGPGTTPVMAAFTHWNPEASRFSDGNVGVFSAARAEATAIRETVFHRERFLAATMQPAQQVTLRCYVSSVLRPLHDIRAGHVFSLSLHRPTIWDSVHFDRHGL